jgi:uncharacterized membrane protein
MQEIEEQPDFKGPNRGLAIGIGLIPIWIMAFFYMTAPNFGGGMYEPTEAQRLTTLTIQIVVYAIAGVLTLAGAVVIWRARSARVVLAAMALLTLPALFLFLLGPAFVLIIGNMTAPSGS